MRIITLSLVKFLQAMLLQICITERIKMSQDIFLRIATIALKDSLKHRFFLNKNPWIIFAYTYMRIVCFS